jgi:class 3 adenylate cyclase
MAPARNPNAHSKKRRTRRTVAEQVAADQAGLNEALSAAALSKLAEQVAANQAAFAKALTGPALAALEGSVLAAPLVKSYQESPRLETTVSTTPNPEAAVPAAKRLEQHASRAWLETAEAKRVGRRIERKQQQNVLVLVADIRKSSQAMIEALDPYEYASTISSFTKQARNEVRSQRGLFDKFTGDGFLAYWTFDPRTHLRTRRRALETIQAVLTAFVTDTMPRFRRNSQSLPSHLGLAFGIDEGLVHFVTIGPDLTIVGRPVVGAVRVADGATASEVLVNVHVGEEMRDDAVSGRLKGIELVRTDRQGKEYPLQMAYAIRFLDFALPEG